MNEAETILEMESVVIRGRWRDGVEALPGPLSLRVRRGETWLVLGGMGSGKSALLEAMVGLRALGGGTVRVFGRELSGLKGAELAAMRRRMGLVFEGRGRLMSGMTVLENVTLPVCYHGNVDVAAAAVEVGGHGGWRWQGRWCRDRSCYCWTIRWVGWTRSMRGGGEVSLGGCGTAIRALGGKG
jgi:predicted ABC-type transport system involved in lysophospholipase L1 biosynthesis ATPase subunit